MSGSESNLKPSLMRVREREREKWAREGEVKGWEKKKDGVVGPERGRG